MYCVALRASRKSPSAVYLVKSQTLSYMLHMHSFSTMSLAPPTNPEYITTTVCLMQPKLLKQSLKILSGKYLMTIIGIEQNFKVVQKTVFLPLLSACFFWSRHILLCLE